MVRLPRRTKVLYKAKNYEYDRPPGYSIHMALLNSLRNQQWVQVSDQSDTWTLTLAQAMMINQKCLTFVLKNRNATSAIRLGCTARMDHNFQNQEPTCE